MQTSAQEREHRQKSSGHQQKSADIDRRAQISAEECGHRQKGADISRRARTSAEECGHQQKSANIDRKGIHQIEITINIPLEKLGIRLVL
ncbi:hypothetical protein [Lentibacillus kapialis]|uniref:hypothetical protein n=1 Tax=Lentibacillus kapialis TaxID=340214 RepID=UPI001665722F|nr:hypothetical protein [Lentibacillus kapialis]